MQPFEKKRILLGVTGGIAAYKAAELVRRLRSRDAEVQVVATAAALEFVRPLTFQALSGHPVRHDLLDSGAEAAMGHIELARWAELLLVAPASADFLARLAAGIADDLLTTACLATTAPIAVAPAMNNRMWEAPATRRNLERLATDGCHIWGPAEGDQACGEFGPGRMLEPDALAEHAQVLLDRHAELAGWKFIITAGPTREAIDPVRFVSNHSSGKQGFALAEAAAAAGAEVVLVAGPVQQETPQGVQRVDVVDACEMQAAVEAALPGSDVFIGVAAVADYRPEAAAADKLKKDRRQATLTLRLTENPDIIARVAARREERPYVVGFAAETSRVLENARTKRANKQLDLIIANDVSAAEIGFFGDDNAVTLIGAEREESLPRMSKRVLAETLIKRIAHAACERRRPLAAAPTAPGDD